MGLTFVDLPLVNWCDLCYINVLQVSRVWTLGRLSAGHKTDPAVISAGLKPDCDMAPPPNLHILPHTKDVMT